MLLTLTTQAQNLDDESRTEVILSGGTHIVLYKAHSTDRSNIFYYLPVNMHLAIRDGRPEISFLQYNEDGNRGAILHFLLTWGLSDSMEREANNLLNLRLKDTVIVAGPVLVDAAPVSFLITGNDTVVSIMNNAISQNSRAPVFPGSKLAASFRFRPEDSDYLTGIIRNHEKTIDGKIQMIFNFRTMVRQGYITKAEDHEWKLSMNLDTIFDILRE
jgi:hypothetical protein